MDSLTRNHVAQIATGLFLFAWGVLVLANLSVMVALPYMPLRYGLVFIGRTCILAALCWIVLSHPTNRRTAILMIAAMVALSLGLVSEIPAVGGFVQTQLNLTETQFERVIQTTINDAFIVLMLLSLTILLWRAGKATDEAEAKEQRLRRIFNQSKDALLAVDMAADRILLANPTASRMLEYSHSDLLETSVSTIFEADRSTLTSLASQEDGLPLELNCRTKSGESYPTETSASPVEIDGRPCLLVIVRDVTQRRETEARLRDSLEQYKLLIEATRVIPWEFDLGTWQFTYVGPQAADVFGYPLDDWYTHKFWERQLYEGDREEVVEFCRQRVARHEDHELEYRMVTADGQVRWIRNIVSVVVEGGRPVKLRGVFIDVTDQKTAERAVLESQSLLRSTMENSPDYVAMLDLEGRVLFINRTGDHLTEEQVVGHTMYEHAPAEFRDEIRECFQRVAETRQPDQFESEYHAPSGDVAVFACRVAPLVKNDEVVGVILNATNVTEKKRAEEALRQSEHRLELAVSAGELGLWDWNISTGEVYFSPEWAEMLGYTSAEIEPRVEAWERLVHPDDRQRVIEAMQQHLKGLTPIYATEHRLKTKAGEWKWVLDRGKVVERDTSGRAVRASGTQSDIDERRQAVEALRHSEALRRSMSESSPDVIMLVDADGTIRYLNRTLPELTIEGVVGTTIYDYVGVEFHPVMAECLARVCETRKPGSYEVDYYSPDEELRVFESRVGPVIEDGDVVALTVHCTDITARRRAEQNRLALEKRMLSAQKLESLGLMAGGVAHDFNNLLTGILGQASLALSDLPKTSDVRGHVARIETAARRASDLCRQLLVFAGRESFSVNVVELNSVVTEMVELLKAVISKRASLHLELADESPSIDGDAAQLGRIVVNLITNASDAIIEKGDEGAISIRTGVTTLGAADVGDLLSDEVLAPGRYAYLEVADTGCGMEEETRKNVFDPFYSTKFTGRGLGLAAVLGIVRGHSGGIQVVTQPAAGTTIRILFPLSKQPQTLSPEPRSHFALSALGGTGTILVVDDEEIVRSATQSALERAGYQVLVAQDGEEGVAIFEDHAQEVAAVLLDVTMPKLDGRRTLDAIHRIRIDVPVIMTSGYERLNSRDLGNHANVDFLQKPYRPHTLIKKLNGILHEDAAQFPEG